MWRDYLAVNPDLVEHGFYSKQANEHGQQEGRMYRRFGIRLHYIACTGLINQQYSHIAAFALGSAIGADLVLPPALMRDSFGSYFSMRKEKNQVAWTPAPIESLLDVDSIINAWQSRGVTVHKVRLCYSTLHTLLTDILQTSFSAS